MTISLKHQFQSANPDGPDASQVQPSNWNSEHTLTCSADRMLGRTTTGTGAVEEISVGTGLSLSAGSLAVGTIPVANGGTGLVAPGTSGNVLTSNGTTWASTAAPGSWSQIATITTTSGATATFSSIPSTYNDLLIVIKTVSHNGSGADPDGLVLALSSDGTTYSNTKSIGAGTGIVASTTISGGIFMPGYTKGTGAALSEAASLTSNLTTSGLGDSNFAWRVDAGIAYIRFSWLLGSSFDAGTITLFGR